MYARHEVLQQLGVACRIIHHRNVSAYDGVTHCWSIYCQRGADVRRAREICRGFREGFNIRGDVLDFLVGVRAAIRIQQKSRMLMESMFMIADSKRLKR